MSQNVQIKYNSKESLKTRWWWWSGIVWSLAKNVVQEVYPTLILHPHEQILILRLVHK